MSNDVTSIQAHQHREPAEKAPVAADQNELPKDCEEQLDRKANLVAATVCQLTNLAWTNRDACTPAHVRDLCEKMVLDVQKELGIEEQAPTAEHIRPGPTPQQVCPSADSPDSNSKVTSSSPMLTKSFPNTNSITGSRASPVSPVDNQADLQVDGFNKQ
jgi:hypothetical protein